MNTTETFTGKMSRILSLKNEENLKGHCCTWNKKTPLNAGFAERILYGIIST